MHGMSEINLMHTHELTLLPKAYLWCVDNVLGSLGKDSGGSITVSRRSKGPSLYAGNNLLELSYAAFAL